MRPPASVQNLRRNDGQWARFAAEYLGCAVGGREEAQAHAPHSSHRADSPRVYVAALTLLYHRPRLMITESGTPARVRPTQSRWLETALFTAMAVNPHSP